MLPLLLYWTLARAHACRAVIQIPNNSPKILELRHELYTEQSLAWRGCISLQQAARILHTWFAQISHEGRSIRFSPYLLGPLMRRSEVYCLVCVTWIQYLYLYLYLYLSLYAICLESYTHDPGLSLTSRRDAQAGGLNERTDQTRMQTFKSQHMWEISCSSFGERTRRYVCIWLRVDIYKYSNCT